MKKKLQFKKAIQGSFKTFFYAWVIVLALFCIGIFIYPLISWDFNFGWLTWTNLKDFVQGINACIVILTFIIFFGNLFWDYLPDV